MSRVTSPSSFGGHLTWLFALAEYAGEEIILEEMMRVERRKEKEPLYHLFPEF